MMILKHDSFFIRDKVENMQDAIEQPYIFLKADENDSLGDLVAQAISLDIRGNYGDLLNVLDDNINNEILTWSGNLFLINIDKVESKVQIKYLIDEDEEYIIDFSEWNEALLDWKDYYLNELGFLAYKDKSLSHMLGVALLTFDQINDEIINTYHIYDNTCLDIVREAVQKCGKRYGAKDLEIIYDCETITGVSFSNFSYWLVDLLIYNSSNRVIYNHIMYNLNSNITYEEVAINTFFKKHFLINLDNVWLW